MEGLQATIEATHWHLIPGGLEFEDADGAFVHVHLSRELYDSLAERMTSVYREPVTPGAFDESDGGLSPTESSMARAIFKPGNAADYR